MSAPPLRVRWQDTAAACDALAWLNGFPAPWEGLWWYEALERGKLEQQFRFLYAEVCDPTGAVLAIAPAFVMDIPLEMFVPAPLVPPVRVAARLFPSLLQQRTLFFGSPCSERGWVGHARASDQPTRSAVVAALDLAAAAKARELGVAMRVWKDFPQQQTGELDLLARRRGLFRVPSFPGTVVELPQGGREAYFLSLKPSRRQKLRRKLRQGEKAAALRCEVIAQPPADLLARLFALFWQTYEHATTRFERLTLDVFQELAAAPEVGFIVLREPEQDEPVAFMLVYVHGPVLINKFIGIDYQRPREWLLYFRLWSAAVDHALALGKSAIESGQTGYAAKIGVGHRMIPLWNYCRHRNPLLHAIYRAIGTRIDWASLDPELAPARQEQDD